MYEFLGISELSDDYDSGEDWDEQYRVTLGDLGTFYPMMQQYTQVVTSSRKICRLSYIFTLYYALRSVRWFYLPFLHFCLCNIYLLKVEQDCILCSFEEKNLICPLKNYKLILCTGIYYSKMFFLPCMLIFFFFAYKHVKLFIKFTLYILSSILKIAVNFVDFVC